MLSLMITLTYLIFNLFNLPKVISVIIPNDEDIKKIYDEYLDVIENIQRNNEYSADKTFLLDAKIDLQKIISDIKNNKSQNCASNIDKNIDCLCISECTSKSEKSSYLAKNNSEQCIDTISDLSFLNKIICVLDVGGSYFKIAYVNITVVNEKFKYEIIRKKEIKYPTKTSYTTFTFWYDWVAEIFVDDYVQHKITPDSISLIFSYPVKYEENAAYPVKFSKFWCFEEKTSLSLDIKTYLENAIVEKIEKKCKENFLFYSETAYNENNDNLLVTDNNLNSEHFENIASTTTKANDNSSEMIKENDLCETSKNDTRKMDIKKNYVNFKNLDSRFLKRLKVRSVLNDSVATFFASKFVDNKKSIGIILGTGTNGSFLINEIYVTNSEWGNFRPKSFKLMKEEELVLCQQGDHCNFLDVICGNGYKSRILSNLLKRENIEIDQEDLDIASILMNDANDYRKYVVLELVKRSSKILSALICAVVKKYDSSDINIILNGSGFCQNDQRLKFVKILEDTAYNLGLKNVKLNILYEEGLTFVGAAYYEYCNFFN